MKISTPKENADLSMKKCDQCYVTEKGSNKN